MSKIRIKTLLIFILFNTVTSAGTITVGKDEQIKTVRQALNICSDGDTILIKKGIYRENNLVLDKQIHLIGSDFPILSGDRKEKILTVKSDNVMIKGIHFADTGISFVIDNSALKLDSVQNCIIENNKFTENFFGVYLSKSSNCVIRHNKIISSNKSQTYSANGIHLWYCKNIRIADNYISGHRDGIYLEFVRNSFISGNYSSNNLRYGLHFMFSDSCTYKENTFKMNSAGVAVMFTHNVRMIGNTFEYNRGDASYGLLLKDISKSEIISNKFTKNSTGIYIEACSNNIITNNRFENNGWAIRLMANSMNNRFEKNNFLGNSFDVTTNSTRNFNTFIHNYWSGYNGYDLNKDGFGDVPHHPVKLFSLLVEKNRPTILLLRSFFMEILNLAESVFPILTPETLIDERPHMSIIK